MRFAFPSPQSHGEHRDSSFFARSGDPGEICYAFHGAGTDRAKDLSPSGDCVMKDHALPTFLCDTFISAECGGPFPWPSSPGQGKTLFLCGLCASVVDLSAPATRELWFGAMGISDCRICIYHVSQKAYALNTHFSAVDQ